MDEIKLKNTFWIGLGIILFVPSILIIIVFWNQGINGVHEWLIPISGFVSLITISIGSWLAVNNYLLNIETEKRLNESTTIQSNIDLLTHFSKMMQIANSRYHPIISEKVIEGLFQNKILTEKDFLDVNSIKLTSLKLEQAILTPSYGLATQTAAISAIYTLGKEHEILRQAAIKGLTSLIENFMMVNRDYKFIEKYIEDLKKSQSEI
jgi:uncharacterized protein YfeS